jgi:1,4-alpha-glucan branching enzyme
MLNDADLDALLAGRHADPFSRLGLHADDNGRLWVRALLPGAAGVALVDTASGKQLVQLDERRPGFFEAQVPRRKHRFDYRLAVRWDDGGEGVYADPYAFYPQLAEEELKAFAEGRNVRPWLSLGAHAAHLAMLHDLGAEREARQRRWQLQQLGRPAPSDAAAPRSRRVGDLRAACGRG